MILQRNCNSSYLPQGALPNSLGTFPSCSSYLQEYVHQNKQLLLNNLFTTSLQNLKTLKAKGSSQHIIQQIIKLMYYSKETLMHLGLRFELAKNASPSPKTLNHQELVGNPKP